MYILGCVYTDKCVAVGDEAGQQHVWLSRVSQMAPNQACTKDENRYSNVHLLHILNK